MAATLMMPLLLWHVNTNSDRVWVIIGKYATMNCQLFRLWALHANLFSRRWIQIGLHVFKAQRADRLSSFYIFTPQSFHQWSTACYRVSRWYVVSERINWDTRVLSRHLWQTTRSESCQICTRLCETDTSCYLSILPVKTTDGCHRQMFWIDNRTLCRFCG